MHRFQCFGPFQVFVDGAPIPRTRSRAALRLLSLLTLSYGKPQSRSFLAGQLWPEATESRALFYLRRTLTEIRSVMGANCLISSEAHSVGLDWTLCEGDLM